MPLELFSKTPIPDEVPEEMQKVIDSLKNSPSQEDCLKTAYEILIARYHGNRLKTFTRFFKIFEKDIKNLWEKTGFLHCTNMNYVMRTLLVKSGMFSDKDIRLRWTQVWYLAPHQYLQVKIGKRWKNIDIWAYVFGIRFGDKASGFH